MKYFLLLILFFSVNANAAMKRFKIKNLVNNLEFQLEAESLKMQPEYGKDAWTETVVDEPAIYDENGVEVTPAKTHEVFHPAEYEIIETDITKELADLQAAEATKKLVVEDLKKLDGKTSLTNAERDKILLYLLKSGAVK